MLNAATNVLLVGFESSQNSSSNSNSNSGSKLSDEAKEHTMMLNTIAALLGHHAINSSPWEVRMAALSCIVRSCHVTPTLVSRMLEAVSLPSTSAPLCHYDISSALLFRYQALAVLYHALVQERC